VREQSFICYTSRGASIQFNSGSRKFSNDSTRLKGTAITCYFYTHCRFSCYVGRTKEHSGM
ncbi:hypothetical protein ACTXT7_008591, partial [Hymenolepis weldensis]